MFPTCAERTGHATSAKHSRVKKPVFLSQVISSLLLLCQIITDSPLDLCDVAWTVCPCKVLLNIWIKTSFFSAFVSTLPEVPKLIHILFWKESLPPQPVCSLCPANRFFYFCFLSWTIGPAANRLAHSVSHDLQTGSVEPPPPAPTISPSNSIKSTSLFLHFTAICLLYILLVLEELPPPPPPPLLPLLSSLPCAVKPPLISV